MTAVDELFVEKQLWENAKNREIKAIDEVKKQLNGLVLYEHCLVMPGMIECTADYALINLRDIEEIIGRVTVTIGFF